MIVNMKNPRQMPKSKIYIEKSKKLNQNRGISSAAAKVLYSDILYGYLQCISQWDKEKGHPRYIPKKDICFSKIGSTKTTAGILPLSRQTVSKRFKNFIDLGLISEDKENDRYILKIISAEEADLIEEATLRYLVVFSNENVISVYNYLVVMWYSTCEERQGKDYIISIDSLKDVIGISKRTRSNNYIITTILDGLKRLGLITYKIDTATDETGSIKTKYYIHEVRTKIPKDKAASENRERVC